MTAPTPTSSQEHEVGGIARRNAHLPVVVIGAGPVGLATAAHLLERGLQPLVLEAGPRVGDAVAQWAHVPFFSPWRYAIDAAAVRLLAKSGWVRPDLSALPTGADLIDRYLQPLADTPQLARLIRLNTEVTAVTRQGVDKTRSIGRDGRPYLVRTLTSDCRQEDITAGAVIDASGTWGHPNPLGANGLPAFGEAAATPWMAGALPDVLGVDRDRFAGRDIMVVGMGHSAANTLLSLLKLRQQEPATEIIWAIRASSANRLYGDPTADELPARGALGAQVKTAVESGAITILANNVINRLTPTVAGRLQVTGSNRDGDYQFEVDVISAATGFRPDLAMLREIRLDIDPGVEAPARLAPLIDPNFHSCGTVEPHGAAMLSHPDENFYIAGMKSYGRAPTFLLATGYEQVRSIAAALAGDHEAADRVELELPETGVCCAAPSESTELLTLGSACCAPPADTREAVASR